LKRFKGSLIYIGFLAVVSFLHFQLETLILKLSAGNFIIYSIYGLFLAFFLLIFIKNFRTGTNLGIAIILLTMGLIFFFLFLKPIFLFKLGILEFFILGILVSLENKKSKSLLPFLLLLGTACLMEIITNLAGGTRFYYFDVWIHSLTGLSGYIAGFLML
jgi:hypothetical protein